MRLPSTFLSLVFFLLLFIVFTSNAHSKVRCIEEEKQALLDFKLSFVEDPYHVLSTWSIHNDECCAWDGVRCDDTGHVTSLDLSEGGLKSYKLRPSLHVLQHLTSLLFLENQFTMRIPEFIGSLGNLTYLDFSNAGFFGEIPPHLGNLSKLESLFLGESDGLYVDKLHWVSRLSSIVHLDFSNVNLTNAIDWASTIKRLPTLSYFVCRSCSLPLPILSHISHINFSSSLKTFDLSNNTVSASTFSYLINGTHSLQHVSLDGMNLESNLHALLESLLGKARSSLVKLTLVGNNLNILPYQVMMFPSLTWLDASSNKISASLPKILRYLQPNLSSLDLSSNLLNGVICDAHFSKFSMLEKLILSNNNLLTFNFSKSWVPPFQLQSLHLSSCKVGSTFPNWILTQKNLYILDISNSSISGGIPNAFWDFSTGLYYLNLSHNQISCMVPNSYSSLSSDYLLFSIDLSYNAFHGPIPLSLFRASILYMSNNKFSSFPSLHHGALDHSPMIINLSKNDLSGTLPNWLFRFDELFLLNLDNNKLSGNLHEAIGSLWQLIALHLSNNMFSGQLPSSMKSCTLLTTLDLANNKLSGVVPSWLGESIPHLAVLTLRSNNFSGQLPSSLCNLQSLQILDLSENTLSGTIPGCLHNFSSMTVKKGLTFSNNDEMAFLYINNYAQNFESESVMWKGAVVELYRRNLDERNVIDLSGNLLRGEIPAGVTTLKELKSLDLSRNDLNGSIPDKIGQLASLEVLKLSSNRLCGEIPDSLAALTFLGTLDLSNNNLSGRIPTSTQLQGFDASSYAGNPKLCGLPLPTKCPGDEGDDKNHLPGRVADEKDDESFDIQTFMAALEMGFAASFLGVLGVLHFNHKWRLAFFQFVNSIVDKLKSL